MIELASGRGRPRGSDSESRLRAVLEHLAQGGDLHAAARLACVKSDTILRRLSSDPVFRSAVFALLDQSTSPAARLAS